MRMWDTSTRHGLIKGLGNRYLNGASWFLPLRMQATR